MGRGLKTVGSSTVRPVSLGVIAVDLFWGALVST